MDNTVSRQASGKFPSSVSRPRRRPSAPSRTMFATSVASARVGLGAKIMLSMSRVTMHGLPTFSHIFSTCFWTANIFSDATTAPSSPRASRTTSAWRRMPGKSRSAWRLSICAMILTLGRPLLRACCLRSPSIPPSRTAPTEMKSTLAGTAKLFTMTSSHALNGGAFFAPLKLTARRLTVDGTSTSLRHTHTISRSLVEVTSSSAVSSPARRNGWTKTTSPGENVSAKWSSPMLLSRCSTSLSSHTGLPCRSLTVWPLVKLNSFAGSFLDTAKMFPPKAQ
mmetsp:Transcript_7272/g.32078  ORF Transcript_7272/g.32078 Transcript_7272/m.32078 type:complete len:280 (+) Transcript_7272:1082-1921(+)